MKYVSSLLLVAIISGCATYSNHIVPAQMSENMFTNLSCENLEKDIDETIGKLAEATVVVDKIASSDNTIVWIGILIMPLALIGIEGDGVEATNYAILKGKLSALSNAAGSNKCSDAIRLALNSEADIANRMVEIIKNYSDTEESGDEDENDF